jgi:hypothetical protein
MLVAAGGGFQHLSTLNSEVVSTFTPGWNENGKESESGCSAAPRNSSSTLVLCKGGGGGSSSSDKGFCWVWEE